MDKIAIEKINRHEVKITALLSGLGSFSTLFQGMYQDNPVAVKRLISKHKHDQNIDPTHEATLQKAGAHANIVKLHGYIQDPPYNMLIMELCTHGDLYDYMAQNPLSGTKYQRQAFMIHIALGLGHLHDISRIIHRDIKPENILITEEDGHKVAKIADFGLALMLEPGITEVMTDKHCGTPRYVAPECIPLSRDEEVCLSVAADVFAFGVMMGLMIDRKPGKSLPTTESPIEVLALTKQGYYEKNSVLDDSVSTPEIRTLIKSCLFTNARKRTTAKEVSTFFADGGQAFRPSMI